MKKNKAITVIELVITMVILIILFFIAIIKIDINGIFQKSIFTNERFEKNSIIENELPNR